MEIGNSKIIEIENSAIIGTENIIDNFISIIVGILIGGIIAYFYFSNITYVGPNSKDIVYKNFKDDDGREFILDPVVVICPIDYSMNKLHDPDFKSKHIKININN